MPLTRHFYNLEEVCAALSYRIVQGQPLEALFWCKELIHSNALMELMTTLFNTWLWQRGPFAMDWLKHAIDTFSSEEVEEDAILLCVYELCMGIRDHTVWHLLCLYAEGHPPDRVTRKGRLMGKDVKESYFLRAIRQGKTYSAWWMAQQIPINHLLSDKTIWMPPREWLLWSKKEYDLISRCVQIVFHGTVKRILIPEKIISIPQYMMERMTEWDMDKGRQSYRRYTIPTACLYGKTRRGAMRWSQHNEEELNRVENYLMGCPFWEEVVAEYGGTFYASDSSIQWESGDQMEAFYDAFFPDDIPDEWTKEEKRKSHGEGILGPQDRPNMLLKYARIHLSHMARGAWNTTHIVHHFLEQHPMLLCDPRAVLKGYEQVTPSLITFEPVTKRFLIS